MGASELEQRITRLEDIEAIKQLKALYCEISDDDHGVPPDISWPNFVEYTRLLAELTGWL